MYRTGTNRHAVFRWLSSFEPDESRMFDVENIRRGDGSVIGAATARVYICEAAQAMGKRFSTTDMTSESGPPRLRVRRVE